MKIIITEQQLNNAVEKMLKQSFPNIVSINFKETPVRYYGGKEGGVGEYTKININVIVDIGDVLEGNLYDPRVVYDEGTDIKKEIIGLLKNYLDIDGGKFKSPYGVNVYTLVTKQL